MAEIKSKVKREDDGKALPTGIGQTSPDNAPAPEAPPVTAPVGPTNREFFGELDRATMFPDDMMVINDITLSDIPVKVYDLESKNDVFIGETLRTKAPIISSNGLQSFSFYLSMAFPPGEAQSQKLRRLVAQITKNPLVYVYSNKIRAALGVKDPSVSTIFIVESGTVRNAAGAIGTLILDLNIHYFNYKPFSNHFWYNAKMPGYNQTREPEVRPDLENRIELSELTGYEASSYTLEYEAESIARNLRSGALRLDTPNNVPVNFPASSDAWMHYADHMESRSNAIFDRTSDYVGFDLKYFKLINPPDSSQRQGAGSVQEQYSTSFSPKKYPDIYNGMAGTPIAEQGKTATDRAAEKAAGVTGEENAGRAQAQSSQGSGSSSMYGRLPVRITFSKTGKSVNGQLVDSNGNIITETHKALSEACYNTSKLKAEKPLLAAKLMFMIQRVADRWPGKAITIYSAWRKYGSGKKGAHPLGMAIDFKVAGVDKVDLFLFVATTFDNGGCGYYPNNASKKPGGGSKFVHMDCMTHSDNPKRARHGMTLWCDASLSGADELNDPTNPVLLKARSMRRKGKRRTEDVAFEAEQAKAAMSEEKEHQKEEDRQEKLEQEAQMNEQMQTKLKSTPTNGVLPTEQEFREQLEGPQSVDEGLANTTFVKTGDRNAQKRFEWIYDLSNQGWNYFWDDQKLRNIFYRNISFDVSSNPVRAKYIDDQIGSEEYRTNYAQNIACTAMSVTFGHRIVPQKLLSQDSTTWQFWGAGNKSGTMVFEFAGPQGKESADKMKRMIYGARENARKFKGLVPQAGSLGVRWSHPNTGEVNSILALLDIRNIVITDFKETNMAGAADKYQLQVSFISQEFEEEEFDQRFSTSIDNKKVIVKGIMDLLRVYTPKDGAWKPKRQILGGLVDGDVIKDWQLIKPWSKYLEDRREARLAEEAHFEKTGEWIGGSGRPYKRNPRMPAWLADVVIEAAKICREADDNIPPTSFLANQDTGETWRDRYKEWGAGIIKGRNHLIERADSKDEAIALGLEVLAGNDTSIGFKLDVEENNKIHGRAYMKWLNRMNVLVDRVRRHAGDTENFKFFFGTVGEDELDSIAANINSCYKDMDLPKLIGKDGKEGRVALPPEFYVYDDSGENTTFSTLTDDANLEPLLRRHIENEVASIEHYIKRTMLGGAYLSRNLPNILEERKRHLDNFAGKDRESNGFQGEMGFLTFGNLMTEGLKTWDPVQYTPDSPSFKEEVSQRWLNAIIDHFGGGDPLEAKTKYLDNLIKLSPYLRDGHKQWTGYDGAPADYLVQTIYDTDYQAMSFGPNPEYTHVDSVINGNLPVGGVEGFINRLKQSDFGKAMSSLYDKAKETAKRHGVNLAATNDGALMTGANSQEIQLQNDLSVAKTAEKITSSRDASEYEDVSFGEYAASIALNIASVAVPGLGYAKKGVNAVANAKIKEAEDNTQVSAEEINQGLKQMPLPNVAGQFSGSENKKLAEATTGIALSSKAKDLSVRRAFPTFRIFFIEDDSHETTKSDGKVVRAFDDFYSYSAVQEIRVSRSRKVAADMAVIRITNIAGKLLRKRFGEKEQWQIDDDAKFGKNAEYATGIFADTEEENPFERMILKDGVKVQIRLGYANNPDNLDTVFLGSIVEISPSEGGKILELVCQGYGAELEGVELGALEDGSTFFSSQQALSGAIVQDSIVNFGRRSKFNKFNPGEVRSKYVGGEGRGLLGTISPTNLYRQWGQGEMYRNLYRYPFKNYPQDDNIFAPPPSSYANFWERFWDNACTYRPLRQTPWQIFKEHELRHPGYISMAVPYGHSPRMTMFFGSKGQHYWSKPPSDIEIYLAENATEAVNALRGLSPRSLGDPSIIKKLNKLANGNEKLVEVIVNELGTFGQPVSVGQEIGKIFGRYRPFRNYHYFDSSHHMLKNNIRTGIDGTFNEVTVFYFDDDDEIADNTAWWNVVSHVSEAVSGDTEAEEISDNVQAMARGEKGVFSCKLDENTPEQYIRSYREEFPSCITEFMAKRYAQGLFGRLLRDAYRGEFIVLGEATLKPYDICYINDTSIGMSGPVEVEAVEHILNRDQGWISIITPDLCVDVNDFYSASVFDVTGAALSHVWGGIDETFATVATAIISPLGLLAVAGGVKFGMWMQEGSPVIATPLALQGKPFISVALGSDRSSFITQQNGKWKQYFDDLNKSWDDLDISEELFNQGFNMQEALYGLFSSDVSIEEAQ